MNNQPLRDKPTKTSFHSLNNFFSLFCLFIASLIFVTGTSAQTAKWRYVMTATDGKKTYLNDEIKNLANRHKGAWEKMIETDGSSVIILAEYDCANKSRTAKQLSFYNSDGALTNIKKLSPEWLEFAPGAIGNAFYARLCLPAQPIKWAQIINPRTALRYRFGNDSPIIRIAYQGELFQIAPESGANGWFNIVDPETQQDYWLSENWFDKIKGEQQLKKQSATTAPVVTKRKPQKPNSTKEKLTKRNE